MMGWREASIMVGRWLTAVRCGWWSAFCLCTNILLNMEFMLQYVFADMSWPRIVTWTPHPTPPATASHTASFHVIVVYSVWTCNHWIPSKSKINASFDIKQRCVRMCVCVVVGWGGVGGAYSSQLSNRDRKCRLRALTGTPNWFL